MKVYLIRMRYESGIIDAFLKKEDAEAERDRLNRKYGMECGYLNPDDTDEYFVSEITVR